MLFKNKLHDTSLLIHLLPLPIYGVVDPNNVLTNFRSANVTGLQVSNKLYTQETTPGPTACKNLDS